MKNHNSEKFQKLWDEYKEFKNKNVTRILKGDRKQNTIDDFKTKSAKNDLIGIWKTIKMSSNLPTTKISENIRDDLDVENVFRISFHLVMMIS